MRGIKESSSTTTVTLALPITARLQTRIVQAAITINLDALPVVEGHRNSKFICMPSDKGARREVEGRGSSGVQIEGEYRPLRPHPRIRYSPRRRAHRKGALRLTNTRRASHGPEGDRVVAMRKDLAGA